MEKSTAVGILSVILLLAALAVSVNAVLASRSYLMTQKETRHPELTARLIEEFLDSP